MTNIQVNNKTRGGVQVRVDIPKEVNKTEVIFYSGVRRVTGEEGGEKIGWVRCQSGS